MDYKVTSKGWKKINILTVSRGKNPKTITGYSEHLLQEGDTISASMGVFTIIKEIERRDAKGSLFTNGNNLFFKALAKKS